MSAQISHTALMYIVSASQQRSLWTLCWAFRLVSPLLKDSKWFFFFFLKVFAHSLQFVQTVSLSWNINLNTTRVKLPPLSTLDPRPVWSTLLYPKNQIMQVWNVRRALMTAIIISISSITGCEPLDRVWDTEGAKCWSCRVLYNVSWISSDWPGCFFPQQLNCNIWTARLSFSFTAVMVSVAEVIYCLERLILFLPPCHQFKWRLSSWWQNRNSHFHSEVCFNLLPLPFILILLSKSKK